MLELECAWLLLIIKSIYLVVVDHKLLVLEICNVMILLKIHGLLLIYRMKNHLIKLELVIVWLLLEILFIYLVDLVDLIISKIFSLLKQIHLQIFLWFTSIISLLINILGAFSINKNIVILFLLWKINNYMLIKSFYLVMKCLIKCLNGNTKINNKKFKLMIVQLIFLNNFYTSFTLENCNMINMNTQLNFIDNYCKWLIIIWYQIWKHFVRNNYPY